MRSRAQDCIPQLPDGASIYIPPVFRRDQPRFRTFGELRLFRGEL